MEKEIKASSTVNCDIHHRVTNYDEFVKKCNEFAVKCQELKQLASDISDIKLSVEYYQVVE